MFLFLLALTFYRMRDSVEIVLIPSPSQDKILITCQLLSSLFVVVIVLDFAFFREAVLRSG